MWYNDFDTILTLLKTITPQGEDKNNHILVKKNKDMWSLKYFQMGLGK
jgi:hypothetical protein